LGFFSGYTFNYMYALSGNPGPPCSLDPGPGAVVPVRLLQSGCVDRVLAAVRHHGCVSKKSNGATHADKDTHNIARSCRTKRQKNAQIR
jgi:hypothetical protein